MLPKLGWLLIALAGAVGWGGLALHRGETISAAWLVLAAVGTYLIAFRFYSRFLAERVFGLDDRRANYAAYLEHLHRCHSERAVPSEREFYEQYVQGRYADGPTRCC